MRNGNGKRGVRMRKDHVWEGKRWLRFVTAVVCLLLLGGCAEYDPEAQAAHLTSIQPDTAATSLRSFIDPASEVRGV